MKMAMNAKRWGRVLIMKIKIVEGAQGSGKTSIINRCYGIMPNRMLFHLSGLRKTANEKVDVVKHYMNMLEFFKKEKSFEYTLLLDRSFVSEAVMSKLYKGYDIDKEFDIFMHYLNDNGIEASFFFIVTNPDSFRLRLLREEKAGYHDVEYNVENSIKQQLLFEKYYEKINDYNFSHIKAKRCENIERGDIDRIARVIMG